MHEFLLAVAVISGWETGQFIERHWIRPWLERRVKMSGCCGTWNQVGRVSLPHWSDDNYKAYYQRMADYRDRTPVA